MNCHKMKAQSEGYPVAWDKFNQRGERLHRLMWETVNGPIPKGKWVLHRCGDRTCINIEHLYLGTRSDNMKDAARHGTLNSVAKRRALL